MHKAQGSEFPAVALLLHAGHHPLLSRKLLYTALSRASKLLVVIAAPGPLGAHTQRKEGGTPFRNSPPFVSRH